MSQLNARLNDSRPDFVYFDVNVAAQTQTTGQPPPFSYSEVRASPFLQGPACDYKMSIIRFSCESNAPVFLPTIQANQPAADLTTYSISMIHNGTRHTEFMTWLPEVTNIPKPPAPSSLPNGAALYSSGYYDCSTYAWLMFNLNLTAKNCMSKLGGDVAETPLFTWDSDRSCMDVYFTGKWNVDWKEPTPESPSNVTTPEYQLFFNVPLLQLFNTLPHQFLGYNTQFGVTPEFNYYIPCEDRTINQVNGRFKITQEVSTTTLLSPFTALVFTSNSLPIVSTQVSAPQVYSNGKLLSADSGQDTSNIISDIKTDDGVYSPSVLYEPSSQYRFVSLLGNQPLYRIDIQVYLRLRTGDLTPLRLNNGCNLTAKLLFQKLKA